LVPQVSALSVSDHFAKWHYLNFHQHITGGFRDAGRQHPELNLDRETIVIDESDPALERCVREAQQLMARISGEPLCNRLTSSYSLCIRCFDQWMI
jgi:hypothetical protein